MPTRSIPYVRIVLLVSAGTAAIMTAGCGGGPNDADPDLVPVSGTVLLDGQPLPDGIVSFVPESGGESSTGEIESGGFVLQQTQSATGAKPGKYKISITSWTTAPTMDAAGKPIKGVSAIPEKYMDPATSGLTEEVKADGANDFTIKLESQK